MKGPVPIVIGFTLIGLAVIIASFLYFHGPGGDGIVGEVATPNGTRYLVTQRWNGFVEPYSVSFIYQLGDGTWGWCYIDHEDTRWPSAQLVHNLDNDSIDVYRGRSLRARLNLTSKTFDLITPITRTVDAPQTVSTGP